MKRVSRLFLPGIHYSYTHKLSDILLLTICAVISGAEGWEDV